MYILTLKFAKDGMFGPYILTVCKYVVFQSAFHKNDNIIQMNKLFKENQRTSLPIINFREPLLQRNNRRRRKIIILNLSFLETICVNIN